MGRIRNEVIVIVLMVALIVGTMVGFGVASAQSSFPRPTGVAVITEQNNWQQQREAIRAMGATFVRIPITQGFGNTPNIIDDVIADGVTHIALQTRGCDVEYQHVYRDLIDQAFQIKVEKNQQVQFYLEIGNEPDICGRSIESYRAAALDTVARIRPLVSYPNLRFVLGLGVAPEYNRHLLSDPRVSANFDHYAYHIYAHGNIGDIPETYNWWRDELPGYGKTILLTEVGINGDIGEELKAQRYREFALQQPSTTEAIAFWTTDPEWKPQYHIDTRMAALIAGVECFAETGKCMREEFADFWHRNGLDFGDPGVSYRESLLLHGYPLTEPFIHPQTGYLTQVFERSVMELHPENPEPYRVLLVHLGRVYLERCEDLCPR